MATYQRPGVYVNETVSATNSAPPLSASAVAAFIGDGSQGPSSPALVTSWSNFVAQFGSFSSSPYLAMALFYFFANGGGNAYVYRIAGTGAATATRILNDTAATPQPTLTVSAANAGTWGNNIYLDVTTGYVAGRFNLVVKLNGTAATNVVETFSDLSMSTSDNRYVVSVINSLSNYISVVNDNSPTAAPNNAPAIQSGTALAGGANGAAGAAADYTNALNSFARLGVPLVLNCPGVSTASIITAVQSTVESLGNIFLVVDPPANQTVTQVESYAASLTADSYTAVYYPWLTVNDPTKTTPGLTVNIPPGGAVVGQFILNDQLHGPYKTPAGVGSRLQGVVNLATVLQPADYDSLNTAVPPVNGIKALPNRGICIYGGRTLQGGYASKYIAIRRSLIYIEQSLKNLTEFAVFQPNDSRLWSLIIDQCDTFLTAYYNQGGLVGNTASDAFYVKCDGSINTASTIQNGQVNIEVGVALEYPAEYVILNIGQSEGGATVSTTLPTG